MPAVFHLRMHSPIYIDSACKESVQCVNEAPPSGSMLPEMIPAALHCLLACLHKSVKFSHP